MMNGFPAESRVEDAAFYLRALLLIFFLICNSCQNWSNSNTCPVQHLLALTRELTLKPFTASKFIFE